MTQEPKPWYRRPWIWVVAVIGTVFLISNFNAFPAGRYDCRWQGTVPDGILGEGEIVVVVGQWPNTYPLELRVYHPSRGMIIYDGNWSHAHGTWERDFYATIPWKGSRYQAFCEL